MHSLLVMFGTALVSTAFMIVFFAGLIKLAELKYHHDKKKGKFHATR